MLCLPPSSSFFFILVRPRLSSFFGPVPCRQRSPADPPRSRQTFRFRAAAKRRQRRSFSASLRPDDLPSVVSHRSILFKKIGGKNLKMPPPWEINFPVAKDTRIVVVVPQSWGRRGGAIGVVDSGREVNFLALR